MTNSTRVKIQAQGGGFANPLSHHKKENRYAGKLG